MVLDADADALEVVKRLLDLRNATVARREETNELEAVVARLARRA